MYLFILFLLSNIAHGLNLTANTTESPPTQSPIARTTAYFTTVLTQTETTSTTIELAADESILVEVNVRLQGVGIDKEWVKNNERVLIQILIDSMDGEDADIEIVIGKITEIWEELSGRRRLLELVLVGVEIEYLIVINEPHAVTVLESKMETGSFDSGFQKGIDETFTEIEINVEGVSYENKGVGDPNVFLGEKKATFGEKIASPYILLGIVCSLSGVIWLIFLQSTIPNNYPSYRSLPPIGGNAVELVPQASM